MTHELPPGWAVASIGTVSTVNPSSATVSAPDDQEVTFLPMAAVEELSGKIDLGTRRPFGEVKKGFTRFRNGDVLFAKITPSMENGKVAVASDLEGGIGCGTTEFHVVRPRSGVSAHYIRYFMVRSAYRQEARRNMQGAVGQQRVPADFLRDSYLPLAPSKEQKRIVSKVDELFSRIDEGERALEQVSKLVERYRQSVLKAAVTGELTRDWREARKAAGEPVNSSEDVLARILTARREAWERAELARMKAKGIKPANDNWKNKYPNATNPKAGLEESIPCGWAQPSLEQATRADRPIAYGILQPGNDDPSGIQMVRVCDVADGVVDCSNLKRVSSVISAQFPRTLLQGGEVLLTLVGTIGRSAVVPPELAGANVARAVGVLTPVAEVLPRWLELCLRSEKTRQSLTANAREVARKTLNVEQLREYAVPIPPIDEQREALSRADEELLSRAGAVVASVARQNDYANALRQSILKSAFAGELIPQDPADEPASTLLEHIAARGVTNTPVRRRGRKKKSA